MRTVVVATHHLLNDIQCAELSMATDQRCRRREANSSDNNTAPAQKEDLSHRYQHVTPLIQRGTRAVSVLTTRERQRIEDMDQRTADTLQAAELVGAGNAANANDNRCTPASLAARNHVSAEPHRSVAAPRYTSRACRCRRRQSRTGGNLHPTCVSRDDQ